MDSNGFITTHDSQTKLADYDEESDYYNIVRVPARPPMQPTVTGRCRLYKPCGLANCALKVASES